MRKAWKIKSHIIDWKVIKVSGKEFYYVIRSNGFIRRFERITEVLHIYDRDDIYRLYDLVYDRWSNHSIQGIEYEILGDLQVAMDTINKEFWVGQDLWEIVRWRFYESCGIHMLEREDGSCILMLANERYPLSKGLMERMLEHRLEVLEETETALDLIKFIRKQISELEEDEDAQE